MLGRKNLNNCRCSGNHFIIIHLSSYLLEYPVFYPIHQSKLKIILWLSSFIKVYHFKYNFYKCHKDNGAVDFYLYRNPS